MVQVLPYVPGFGEQLAQALGGATKDIIGGVKQRRAQSELDKLFQAPKTHPQAQVGEGEAGPNQAPQMSEIEKIFAKEGGPTFADVTNIRNKLEAVNPGSGDTMLSYYLQTQKNQQAQQVAQDKARREQDAFNQRELHHQEDLDFRKSQEENKTEKPKREKRESAEALISNVKKMRALIPYTGTTVIPGQKSFGSSGPLPFNRAGIQKRNQFDVLAASAASFFRDLETKGQLPIGLFNEVIKPRLPNSKLSERENNGRLDGIIDLAETYGGFDKKEDQKIEKSEVNSGHTWIISPSGQRVPIPNEEVERALSSGGKLA